MDAHHSLLFDGLFRVDFAVRFLVAILCGGAIGMERETTGKPAGLRTCIVVSLGAMLFTSVGMEIAAASGGDSTRIAAQIVTGIGVILRSRQGEVRGVTTAAMIWLVAAIGMMIGAGYVLSSILVTVASVLAILVLRHVEERIRVRHARRYCFVVGNAPNAREHVLRILSVHEDRVRSLRLDSVAGSGQMVRFIFVGTNEERRQLLESILAVGDVRTEPWPSDAGDAEPGGILSSR